MCLTDAIEKSFEAVLEIVGYTWELEKYVNVKLLNIKLFLLMLSVVLKIRAQT